MAASSDFSSKAVYLDQNFKRYIPKSLEKCLGTFARNKLIRLDIT
jgi:hypothetical protein